MFLYKLEIITEENQSLVAVILAETDEKAFSYAESQIRRQFLVPPKLTQISLVEKKYVEKGKGYLIEATAL
ncbi:DUF3906 family protein [Brevibacillus ginsengisoli]|uniref:DUF3906 family protein n=1 Tax=Brevibacillus ginsengisoli TaxID=363854 RepID=UPI003CF433BA